MSFERWDNDHWTVKCRDDDHYILHAPGTDYVFNKHDFLELQRKINEIDVLEKVDWFVDGDILVNRRTGETLIGLSQICLELSELSDENKELRKFAMDIEHAIRKMYVNEKTEFGKNTIKGVLELFEG